MDLREVGKFFTDKIAKKELNVQSLGPTGFQFLQQYFLSLNEKEEKLEKVKPKTSYGGGTVTGGNYGRGYSGYSGGTDYRYSWSATGGYSYANNNANKQDDSKEKQKFSVKVHPSELLEIDMIWTLALEAEHPEVVGKVIDFFIQVHQSLAEDKAAEKSGILRELIQRLFGLLTEAGQTAAVQRRIIAILKTLINETEAAGASSIVPHGALMKGETCEVTVKNEGITQISGELSVVVCSNTTLW